MTINEYSFIRATSLNFGTDMCESCTVADMIAPFPIWSLGTALLRAHENKRPLRMVFHFDIDKVISDL